MICRCGAIDRAPPSGREWTVTEDCSVSCTYKAFIEITNPSTTHSIEPTSWPSITFQSFENPRRPTSTMSRQLISSEKFPPKPHNCKQSLPRNASVPQVLTKCVKAPATKIPGLVFCAGQTATGEIKEATVSWFSVRQTSRNPSDRFRSSKSCKT